MIQSHGTDTSDPTENSAHFPACFLCDLPVATAYIKHVGKEGNELDELDAGLIEEWERNVEYHGSELDDLVRLLRDIPTKLSAETTGYNARTVRRLKRGSSD